MVTRRLISLDVETHLVQPGLLVPPLVCGSTAEWPNKESARLLGKFETLEVAATLLADPNVTITGANLPFDFAVIANEAPSLLKPIFKAYEEGRVHDILLAQALDAVAGGHLGLMPTGMPLFNAKGKRTDRYDLDICVRLVLHRYDAKANDLYRMRYAILDRVPMPEWPAEATQYPIDDAWNEVEVAAKQLGIPAKPPEELVVYGDPALDEGASWVFDPAQDSPQAQPAPEPFRNLRDQASQARAAWALHLGASWGFQADPLYIELLELRAKELHKVYVDRFAKIGLYKLDKASEKLLKEAEEARAAQGEEVDGEGDEADHALAARLGYKRDTAAVARAVAQAYGAEEPCPRCEGEGKIRRVKQVPCRGVKGSNRRFLGCLGGPACVCGGTGTIDEPGNVVICAVKEGGCGGTGFDIDPKKVPALPRTKTNGVSSSRDTLMESGHEDLHDFGLNQQAKVLRTYLPYLRKGIGRPLTLRPNVVLETGRVSYDELIQLFPRWTLSGFAPDSEGLKRAVALAEAAGRADVVRALLSGWVPSPRECLRARRGRVLGSTDYAALEMCTLAQVLLWLFKKSRMADIINETKKPGHLHSALGARILNISFEEMLARLEAKDKVAKDARQASKPVNFGLPGRMGAARLVLTSREEKNGHTDAPDGKRYSGIRFCILVGGAERCGEKKITQWGKQIIPPTCLACLRVAKDKLIPAWFSAYPEMEDYFKWVDDTLEATGGVIPCFGPWICDDRVPEAEREPHRVRGGCARGDASNNSFQGLAACGAKDAYWEVTKESYTDESSPLFQATTRAPGFIHDELLTEMDEGLAHLAGPRVAEVMVKAMRKWVPDVHISAETALMEHWNKDAQSVYDADGKLTVWTPEAFL
jgi:hypothetical protein